MYQQQDSKEAEVLSHTQVTPVLYCKGEGVTNWATATSCQPMILL